MRKLTNRVLDEWVEGDGVEATLVDPTTGEPLAEASAAGIDLGAALNHAREVGGPALRTLTFAERGALLQSMSTAIHEHREELIDIGVANCGNTRGDAKFDIDGATGTLMTYGKLGAELGDRRHLLDGEPVPMGRSSRIQGRHGRLPRRGCAVTINAFNFPAWGFAEKAACAILAGVPVVTKPATLTAMMAHRIVEIIVERELLPPGTVSFICGPARGLLDHVAAQDCIAFTGSAATGRYIRAHPRVLQVGARVNVEADSLNAAVLGPDVDPDSDLFDLFIRDVVTDMTQKAGQKCTAIRRVLVPESVVETVRERLAAELERIVVGDPRIDRVRMGPLAGPSPHADARKALERLLSELRVGWGDPERTGGEGVAAGQGEFMHPLLLEGDSAVARGAVHEVEVFGPVSTLLPYDGTAAQATKAIAMAEGCLVSSFYSDDRDFAASMIEGAGPHLGRMVWGSKRTAGQAPAPGIVFPSFIHGGPGRAGDGEELGGVRGLEFYTQRIAVQGFGPLVDRALGAGE